MSKRYSIAVHDLNGKKLCVLYDSLVEQMGAVQKISFTKNADGWKEMIFTISKQDSNGEYNFRWDHIQNENLVYTTEGTQEDVYCIKVPNDMHDGSGLKASVTCNHISEELKTKNLYKYFDDTNGIGTCEELISKAIGGTGWTLLSCDTMLESDGVTEKVRSYNCDSKTGAQNMIAGICELFNARPVFHGKNRAIEIKAKTNTEGYMEILFGKNLESIKRSRNSSNIVTRLYVEGEYGDYGYVGIDDVNPTGLPFILNFDYFKELGLFTEVHEKAVEDYVAGYKQLSDAISEQTKTMMQYQAEINELIGSEGQVYFVVENGKITGEGIYGADIDKADIGLFDGDNVAVISVDGSYEQETYPDVSLSEKIAVIKFDPTITGKIAAWEDKITASEHTIESYLEKLNKYLNDNDYLGVTVDELKSAYGTEDLSIIDDAGFDLSGVSEKYKLPTTIEYASSIGDEENSIKKCMSELKTMMLRAIELMKMIFSFGKEIENSQAEQETLDNDFAKVMGTMLRDGYWSDNNYAPGQEESLYKDAYEISQKLAKVAYSYVLKIRNLCMSEKYKDEEFVVAQAIRIYDKDLNINDHGVVSKTVIHPDDPDADSVSVETDLLDIGNKTFASVLERVTQLAEQVRQNKDVYKRAAAIAKDGTFDTDLLSGAIDVMRVQLLSGASNWKTDEKGNILLESLDGLSAMMLCGNGFMIANSKTDSGEWDWRTFGTGDGFAADMITTGFLSADRIQAESITTRHISSNVGSEIDISKNSSIELTNKRISMVVDSDSTNTELILTDEMMQAIADKFSLIANKIDLSANESITLGINKTVKDIVEYQAGYRLEIVSTSDVLSSDIKSTTLAARVWNGRNNITDELDASLFNWKRTSVDTVGDAMWNSTHKGMKSITLSTLDVYYSATYTCELTDDKTAVLGEAVLGKMILGD